MDITNNSKAAQGVHVASGVVYIQPGETKSVELTDAGLKLAKRLDFLSVKASTSDAKDAAEPAPAPAKAAKAPPPPPSKS